MTNKVQSLVCPNQSTHSTNNEKHKNAKNSNQMPLWSRLQLRHTSHTSFLNDSSSAPPVGIIFTLHARTSYAVKLCTIPDPATRRKTDTSVITKKNITTTVTTSKGTTHTYTLVWFVILVGTLHRRNGIWLHFILIVHFRHFTNYK